MKPPILIGIVLGVILLALGIFSPLLQSASKRAATQARTQAAHALGELDNVDVGLDRATPLLEREDEQLNAAAETAGPELQRLASEYDRFVREARQEAERMGLPAPQLPAFSADAGGAKRAVQGVEKALHENDALLKKVLADAGAAVSLDGNAIGAAQVQASAQYVQAFNLLAVAAGLRTEQIRKEGALLDAAVAWRDAQGLVQENRQVDTTAAEAALRKELEHIATEQAAANERVTALQADVQQRTTALAAADEELKAATAELRRIEDEGFHAGDDESFQAYRNNLQAAQQRATAAEALVAELRFGGQQGAVLVGDDPTTAKIEGGETFLGLEELQRRLTGAEAVAERWNGAGEALTGRGEQLRQLSDQASSEATRYEQRVQELAQQQQTLAKEVDELSTQAFEKEADALRAADAAARAFGQSQRAVDGWVREAQQTQRDRDPDRKNERLLALINDKSYMLHYAASMEAAAEMLAARILAQRIESDDQRLHDMQALTAMNPAITFDPATVRTQVDEARTAALEKLEKARTTYDRLAKDPTTTSWVPLASLAAAYHLTARVDPSQAAVNLEQARAKIQEALQNREKFPYAKELLPFLEHMEGPGGQAMVMEQSMPEPEPVTPAAEPTAEPTPTGEATTQPAEESSGEDFFK